MIQVPCSAHFSACWSSYNWIHLDIEPPTRVTPSLIDSSASSTASTMVKQRSKLNHSSKPTNQLFKQVSPFEELPVSDELYPFDETLPDYRHDVSEKRDDPPVFSEVRDMQPRDEDTEGGIPKFIFIPKNCAREWDNDSEVTLGKTLLKDQEERTLTPHPSFDDEDNEPTAFDFHYLYNASLQLGDQDWPSDEDGPAGTPRSYNHKLGGHVMMVTKDIDDGVSKKEAGPNVGIRYRLV